MFDCKAKQERQTNLSSWLHRTHSARGEAHRVYIGPNPTQETATPNLIIATEAALCKSQCCASPAESAPSIDNFQTIDGIFRFARVRTGLTQNWSVFSALVPYYTCYYARMAWHLPSLIKHLPT
eukprot:3117728-Amphidinium_carterae.2